ncbi:hypothetical protein H0H93_004404 [Arthromyces matolae]|nr:hypothetical protein H0H93_004404 [Arthromyces matolae]
MLRDNSQNRSDVSFANLRGLKSLDINFLPADPWSQIPPEVLFKLDHLGLEIGMPDEGRLNGILALSVNLTSLVLCWIDYEPGQLIRIAQNAPQLERLGIRWNIYNDAVESIRNDLSPWRSVLKSLLHLTHLGAIPLEAFFPPLDGSWYQQGWATQGVGLGDRISTAVERLCLAEDAAQLQRIHFISDMNGTNDIWAFLDPLTHQVKQFSVLPELEDSPKGLFDIPWSGCFIAGLETNHDPIGCGTSNPAKLPTWPY